MYNPHPLLHRFAAITIICAASALGASCGDAKVAPHAATTTTTPTTNTSGVHPSRAASTVVAVGDIACSSGSSTSATSCGQTATVELARRLDPAAVLTLGDEQYDSGELEDFNDVYDASWGKLASVTRPTPGNHEYAASRSAAGYRAYFGRRATPRHHTYYSYELGSWHLIALDSNCAVVPGGCEVGSPQQRWLANDLRTHRTPCALAYWHHPRFSSGLLHGSSKEVSDLYATLDAAGADVVLTGHEHNYERFAPQDHAGVATEHGIRQFVVGTGGRSLYPFGPAITNSEVRSNKSFGVLELELGASSYSWRFHPTSPNGSHDHGEGTCR